jgi:transposase InsO family protein
VEEAAKICGVGPACGAIGISRANFYRRRKPTTSGAPPQHPSPARPGRERALTPAQQEQVLSELNSERFLDCSPRQVWATLLDEEIYLCSWRTMYRLLKQHDQVRERRNVRRHPKYTRPELAASGPNQVWTWDITYLKGPVRGQFYYLYVVIDIYSRLVVGWLLADRECEQLARRLLEQSYRKHGVQPGQLTVHADRGAPMKSKSVKQLLSDLDVRTSHSRPRVSNDNPYSEAGFKTMKYSPDFPARFGSFSEAEAFCELYFVWYNQEHYHMGIALLTPAQVHYGEAEAVLSRRQATLDAAFAQAPERFGHRRPQVARLPATVWINRPSAPVCEAVA